jgi:hypothetical protein
MSIDQTLAHVFEGLAVERCETHQTIGSAGAAAPALNSDALADSILARLNATDTTTTL